jgi:hypothetical protein
MKKHRSSIWAMYGFVDLSWKVMWETCRNDRSAAADFDSGRLESSTAVMSDRGTPGVRQS